MQYAFSSDPVAFTRSEQLVGLSACSKVGPITLQTKITPLKYKLIELKSTHPNKILKRSQRENTESLLISH